MSKRRWRRTVGAVMGFVVVAGLLAAVPAKGNTLDEAVFDCNGDLGDPEPGTAEWEAADENNRWCANHGTVAYMSNPARHAAMAANLAQGGLRGGDPFREPTVRWAGVRGEFEELTWTDRNGVARTGMLFSPLGTDGGPYPGVMMPCHTCPTSSRGGLGLGDIYWGILQTVAEHGYVVMFVDVGDDTVLPELADATDFFVSTPQHPSPQGEVNPWHERLDRTRLGIMGHSGSGAAAVNVGNLDDRYDAVVTFDRSNRFTLEGLKLRIPTMIQVADYGTGEVVPFVPLYEPRNEKPEPQPGTRYTDFDAFRAARVDTMQVSVRASTHGDHTSMGGSLYGHQVFVYYTLAWLDRYVKAAVPPGPMPPEERHQRRAIAADATKRLTTTGTFDRSADQYSIGTGRFDPVRAAQGGSIEAGNVPVTIEGLEVTNLLSFFYPTRYFLDRGKLQCEDMRAGCRR